MKENFALQLAVSAIGAAVILLVCKCEQPQQASHRTTQIIALTESEEISVAKLGRALKGVLKQYYGAREVGQMLAKTREKLTANLTHIECNCSVKELLDLNVYDSVNMTDCTLNEIERRQGVCQRTKKIEMLNNYCMHCLNGLIQFCRKSPYLELLRASLAKFDWRPHGEVFKFAEEVAQYITRDGNEFKTDKQNVLAFLELRDENYTMAMIERCRSFERALKDRLLQFETEPKLSYELLEDLDKSLFMVRERCNATEPVVQRMETYGRRSSYEYGYESYG